ncbi:hypothetical protein [Bacillus dakarensis]|uniref:hypothetical protein n=1 Tax=Robertmurraya dakarensis TaxID=1926278 RepID=UPI000981C273|nr:hypothetical protein [Bacillus dakarensis]
MNINAQTREDIARSQSEQQFLIHVADQIQRQLKEWSSEYRVYLMKLTNYELTIGHKERFYQIEISEEELRLLQGCDPYALDRKIWNTLRSQGLSVQQGVGNYIDTVL